MLSPKVYQKHPNSFVHVFSFISMYLGFKNSDKILAGLGLFALSFWASWFDPVTRDISEKTGSTPETFEEFLLISQQLLC